VKTQSRRLVHTSLWILAAILAFIPIRVPQAQEDSSADDKPQPGCPFKVVREQVEKIFGQYDNAVHSGGEIEGGEIPRVIKVEQLSLYTCIFQRKGEVLQFIANLYPEAAAAGAGFDRASKVKNANGAFYTSQRQIGSVQVFEGPGRAIAHQGTQVVMAHWLVGKGGKPVPADVPGSRLTPILQAWLSATGEK
jgi:hypothetical protein